MEGLILNEKNVRLQVSASDWEDAIRIGGNLLVEQGCAKPSYIEGIIHAVKELGPYIIITDGLAMPHTRPEEGALNIGCSLITLKEPVWFEGEDVPVKVMICFSAVDSESHMDILKMIVEFVERGLIDDIAKAETYEELLDVIQTN
nr:PTS sugar transporter subunit IIA [uncultured Anaerostipes sp.]